MRPVRPAIGSMLVNLINQLVYAYFISTDKLLENKKFQVGEFRCYVRPFLLNRHWRTGHQPHSGFSSSGQ